MSGLPISRLICSHDFYWSRRRQADICRRCGALSPVLALHFRSKSAWTVGADLPPERMNGRAPAVDVPAEPAETTPQLAAPEPAPSVPEPVIEPVPAPAPQMAVVAAAAAEGVARVEAAPAPEAPSDPFSLPIPVADRLDFSTRGGAPLQRPLVT